MQILEAISRLRDDLKAWVTNNLNALDTKIDQNTVSIDNQLDKDSTNPIQNKAVSEAINAVNESVGSLNTLVGDKSVADQIESAINKQNHFSGDYNDLTNAPNIIEDESGLLAITDESGYVVIKVDNDGLHTTALTIDGENVLSKFNDKVDKVVGKGLSTNDYTDADKAKLALINSDIASTTIDSVLSVSSNNPVKNKVIAEAFVEQSSEIAQLKELVGTSSVSAQISNAIAEQEHFSGDYTDLTSAPDITEDSTDNLALVDGNGNVLFKADADGIHTTNLTINGENLFNKIDTEFKNISTAMDEHDRFRVGLLPLGKAIAENTDLNTIEYLSVGSYYCSANKTVATLVNCPTVHAFLLQVYSPLSKNIDNEETGQWIYRVRKMLTYEGQEYIQVVYSGAVPGEFTYKDWEQSVTIKELNQYTQSMMSKTPVSIELNQNGGLNKYGGFIDFHYHDTDGNETGNTDYSSRIIENEEGIISVNNVKFDINTQVMSAVGVKIESAETWTFIMDDGTAINKLVVVSQ